MDQYVLASIIRGLNATVADVTKERDELREQLAKSESGKTGAENSLLQFSTRCKQMEQELEEARTKMKDDEHSISMLRTKVEESRLASIQWFV
jgi:chromosome segregation ATPase